MTKPSPESRKKNKVAFEKIGNDDCFRDIFGQDKKLLKRIKNYILHYISIKSTI